MKRVLNVISFEAKSQKPHDIRPYIDRDYNASLNIKECGTRLIAW